MATYLRNIQLQTKVIIVLVVIVALFVVVAVRNSCSRSTLPLFRAKENLKDKIHINSSAPIKSVLNTADTKSSGKCELDDFTYPSWPTGFNVSVDAAFIAGEQKSGSTWLWELLDGHPCLITSNTPHQLTGAITTKETYWLTWPKVSSDAREFLTAWLGRKDSSYFSDEEWKKLDSNWFKSALKLSQSAGTTDSPIEYGASRTYAGPMPKLKMKACSKYYILEATPHNLHSPIVAKRIKNLWPNAKIMAVLKEPVWRMHSAYNQFSKPFLSLCRPSHPEPWCPMYRYYQLRLPSFTEIAEQDIQYLRSQGCSFQTEKDTRSWLECFGCGVMNPWKHKAENIHIEHHPYTPSTALGMYAPMIKAYTEYFPLSEMRFVNYAHLVDNPLEVANHLLRYLGLEEYTQSHMDIIRPEFRGFKGNYANGTRAVPARANEILQEFFAPLNQQLNELLADHPIPWHPFDVNRTAVGSDIGSSK